MRLLPARLHHGEVDRPQALHYAEGGNKGIRVRLCVFQLEAATARLHDRRFHRPGALHTACERERKRFRVLFHLHIRGRCCPAGPLQY